MNAARLLYEMKLRNISQGALCAAIGMSRSAFYRKCKGVTEFTQKEIQSIMNVLGLKSPVGIFFNDKVS